MLRSSNRSPRSPASPKVRPVVNYEMTLSETVPYVGGTAVQQTGSDGTGVTVAVLDSGIDYTHRNLGGAGTLEAYAAAYGAAPGDPPQTTLDGLFPTAKVVGGFDFVGEAWPTTEIARRIPIRSTSRDTARMWRTSSAARVRMGRTLAWRRVPPARHQGLQRRRDILQWHRVAESGRLRTRSERRRQRQ